jgi:hypothetical protein
VVAAARSAAAAADVADTVATSTAAGAGDAPAPKKRGRPRKAAETVQDPAAAEAGAAPKPRGRKKKDTMAEGDGAQPAPEAKQKAPRKKKEALDDGAVRNLKLQFDKDEAEQQMVRHIQLSSGIDGVVACAQPWKQQCRPCREEDVALRVICMLHCATPSRIIVHCRHVACA